MEAPWQQHSRTLGLWLIVLTTVFGCTGRRITTAVEDQTFQPGPSPVPVVEAAKVVPPTAVVPEPPKEEPGEPARVEEPKIEVLPTKPPVEEVRVEEQPVAPAHQPAVQPVQPAAVSELSDIFFDFDQYAIRGDARSGLEANAGPIKSQPHRTILIEGHCDERGTSAYNLVLGERRAQATKQYLRDLGVPSSQIQITSYGKERPFCAEHSESCWQSNRRAHFRHP
ncbi:MAG: peptidoglycan-associated lipoprotein [Nitrospira sp.]|nr:MAG: peptidoglycan-associated lipoprotein [Nitrospira sp.]